MGAKLLIMNNGLRDLRGHYFETGVSVAEAAAAAGLEPYLVGHADCSREVLNASPDVIPLCRTDHLMSGPPAIGPRMHGIKCDPAAIGNTRISSESSLRDYLHARFEPPVKAHPKRGLRAYVPPLALRAARSIRSTLRAVKSLGRELLPPVLRKPALSAPVEDSLSSRLTRAGRRHEHEYALLFQEDLERAIGLIGVGPSDHVFLPTAHGRELIAVQRIVEKLGEKHAPTFHLEFRHMIEFDNPGRYEPINPDEAHWLYVYTAAHRVYFDWARRSPLSAKIRCYTDTEELTQGYAQFSGLPFKTLPIPFRTERIANRVRKPDEAICIAYLGDVRDEKGFPWLPALVAALQSEAESGRVRFLFQASLSDHATNPESAVALKVLREMSSPYIRLPGADGPLNPDEYFKLLSEADVILCPYDPEAYQRRSSGTMTEALASGVPTVVPAGSWLHTQQPAGTGTSFRDQRSFLAAVRDVVADYTRFSANARAHRDEWRAVHNPGNLVRTLLSPAAPNLVPVAA